MRFEHENLGESALLLRLGDTIDARVNARVHALAQALGAAAMDGIDDLVPAYVSVLLRYDPAAWDYRGDDLLARVRMIASALPDDPAAPTAGALHVLPVCYGGEAGADLHHVADHCGLQGDEVVALHTAPEYRVAMLGFAPGFAYLLGMDPRLHMPRRDTPRTRVPAGSVGIGGAQTGIYPRTLPGGWQLIGRTPLRMFDAHAPRPCRLHAGDRVRFEAIDETRFGELQAAEESTC